MKHTQQKDAVRNIRKQVISYLSIVVIAMLAVLAYLGINFASKAIGNNANAFYARTKFRDIQVISTMLLTQEDLAVIESVEGVEEVEGVFRTDAKIVTKEKTCDVMVVSLTQNINVVEVVEGRLPETPEECVIEKTVDDDTGLKIGDTVKVVNSKGETPKYLTNSEYKITGIVYHPDHSCWPMFTPGARYVLVMPGVFDAEELENCCMTAEIAVAGTDGMDVYDPEYLDKVDAVAKRIEAASKEREQLRFNYIKNKYKNGIDEGQAQLDEAEKKLADARTELDTKWAEYNDGIKKLAEGKATIEENEKKLADAKVELEDAKKKLDDAEKQLADGKAQLDDAKDQLDSAKSQLADAEQQLDEARMKLADTYRQIEEVKDKIKETLKEAVIDFLGEDVADEIEWSESKYDIDVDDPAVKATYLRITTNLNIDLDKSMGDNIFAVIASLGYSEEDLREAYEATTGLVLEVAEDSSVVQAIVDVITASYSTIEEKYDQFATYARQWYSGHEEYLSKLEEYNAAKEKYDDGLETYNDKKSLYDEKYSEYEDGKSQYEDGLAKYEAGKNELENGKTEYDKNKKLLEDGKIQLEDGEKKYSDGVAEFEDSKVQLDKAREDMAILDSCRWVILDVNGSAGYIFINNGKNNVNDLGGAFAIIFILVGALVIYATVGRIVEEQRKLVGATKALGLYNREILIKYMLFGVTGTFFGMILGFILGYFGIQRITLGIYGRYYVFGPGNSAVNWVMTALVFAGGIILSTFTVWFACTNLMKSTAISLMQESVPDIKKKSRNMNKRKRGKGSLYGRMILLNMLTDKKRVIVTIASIAGVCCLLVAGMTMNFAVNKSIKQQFSDIEMYDLKITYDAAVSDDAEYDIEKILKDEGVEYICISDKVSCFDGNGKLSSCELLCGDLSELNTFFARRDPDTMQMISDKGEGLWIHVQTAKKYNLKVGDQITIYDPGMNPYNTTITGIFENRVGLYAAMDSETYFKIFNKRAVKNTFLVTLNGKNAEAVTSRVSQVEGFMDCVGKQKRFDDVMSIAKVLDYLSFLFIGIAGMMAYFILLNLVNMYITQKTKELTIMRINGFTVGETIRYVSLELIASTVIGIVLGLLLGSALGFRILNLLEGASLHIIKDIQFEAWGVAALITVFFSTLVSAWALRKVKYLKLTDV